MSTIRDQVKNKPWLGWLLFFGSLIIVFLLGLLVASVSERRAEAVFTYAPKVKISQFESRNSVWGKNYPREYDTYMQTADTSFRSLHNGSASIDMLESDPRLVILWAGYGFSKEYKQGRGHYYAINDIRNILRTGAPKNDNDGPQPNTCWSCKSPDVPRIMNSRGIAEFYKGKWASLGSEIVNPIGCADCHDAETMKLVITRPALIEAFKRQGKDIKKVSFQEMRTLVCAQCHVEYYFKGEGNYLTFPWDKGTTVDAIEKYYDEITFSDWTHGLSKTPMLKAQHPDYEIFKMGIHAQRGLACADCHMPYMSEGGQKFTNHKIQSPLNNISNTCQVCHRQSEDTLRNNVYERQNKNNELKTKLEQLLVNAHFEAKAAWDAGAKDDEMKDVLTNIRHSQWRWDFAAASHGASFHAPLEVARMLSTGIDKAGEARRLLAKILAAHDVKTPIALPDVSTKDKAQKYIGLDMAKLKADKKDFIKNILPQWDKMAVERESKLAN